MMTLPLPIPDTLLQEFTTDGRELIEHYFTTIVSKLETLPGGVDKHQKLLDDMISYIGEFIDEEAQGGLVSYKQTMDLIDRLGTPTEIVSSISQEPLAQASTSADTGEIINICQWCNYHNSGQGSFCENCGRNMNPKRGSRRSLRQFTIDHPYQMAFLVSYLGLLVFSMIWELSNNPSLSPISSFWNNIWRVLLPAVLLGIVVGYLIAEAYKDAISFEEKYKKVVEKYEEQIIFRTFIPLIIYGPFMGVLAIISGTDQILPIMGVFIGLIFMTHIFLMVFRNADKEPTAEQISYHHLITGRKRVDTILNNRLKKFAEKRLIYLVGLVVVVFVGLDVWLNLSTLKQLGLSLMIGIFSYTASVANYAIYTYSWPEIIKIIKNEQDLA